MAIGIALMIQNIISDQEETLLIEKNSPNQSSFCMSILSLLSGLMGADILMTGIRLIW
jgi:hypothetical protein